MTKTQIRTQVALFSGDTVALPPTIPGWDVDDNNNRYEIEYTSRHHASTGKIVSPITNEGLFDLFQHECMNPFEGNDGTKGRPEISRVCVSLHCVEILYVVEVIRFDKHVGCYKLLGVYERSI